MITNYCKLFSMLLFLVLSSNFAKAQESKKTNYDQGFRLGFGLSNGFIFQRPYHFSYGGDVRIQYDLSKRYSLTLTTGFTNLSVSGAKNDIGFIPVKAGYKTFVWEDKFYAMGEIGAAFATTNQYHKISLLIAPSVGYVTKYIDISLRYERYADFPKNNDDGTIGDGVGQVALRLAYGFRL